MIFKRVIAFLFLVTGLFFLIQGCGSSSDSLPQSTIFSVSANVLKGVCSDKNFNTVLSGVTVSLKNSSGIEVLSATTNTKGSYQFVGVEKGSYTLVFILKGYTTHSESVTFSALSGTEEKNVQLSTVTLLSITGLVTDSVITASGATPLQSVDVVAVDSNSAGYSAFSNASGSFLFNIPAESYSFTFSREFYTSKVLSVVVNSDGTTSPASISVALEKNSGTVTGTVNNQVTNTGANNVLITMVPRDSTIATPTAVLTSQNGSTNGYFTLTAQEGVYDLQTKSDSFVDYSEKVTVTRNTDSTVTLSLTPKTITITGTVRDLSNGSLIENAVITTDVGPGAVTDASGTYTLNNVPSGTTLKVTASRGSFAKSDISVTPVTGETLRVVDFGLETTVEIVSLAGTVTYLGSTGNLFVASEFSGGAGLTVDIVKDSSSGNTGFFVLYFPGASTDEPVQLTGVVRRKDNGQILWSGNINFTKTGTVVMNTF